MASLLQVSSLTKVYGKRGASTRALDGRLSASTDEFEVSWTYHPDNGLEAMFEIIE